MCKFGMDVNFGFLKVVYIMKFIGYLYEDLIKFLDEFDSYLILYRIKMNVIDFVVCSFVFIFNWICFVVV